jgi:phospholipid/cholesterol/gamma-HCH transport system ATP-binding protein
MIREVRKSCLYCSGLSEVKGETKTEVCHESKKRRFVMKVKNFSLVFGVLLLLVLAYQPAQAGVNVGVGVSVGLPVFNFAAPPQLAVIPGTYAYYAPDVDLDILFYGGRWSPARGKVLYENVSFWDAESEERERIMKTFGVLYQAGALWSSMTIGENVALPLQHYTKLGQEEIEEIVALKLSLVGLSGFGEYYPSEISGGMKKRAGLARAMALDPEVLYFDEPSAGLDPITAHMLDELMLEIRESLGATLVVVTHDLESILAIGNNSVFLDADTKTMIASGDPKKLLAGSDDPRVVEFLTRGKRNADKINA